jgi:putative ABC transport system permease protein
VRLMKRMRSLFRRSKLEHDLDDELRFHLEMKIEENIASGMSRDEARYAALRAFGNPGLKREEARDMWGWIMLERLIQDVRYGLRNMRRSPGFTAVAALTLALGIGANTAIFSVLDALVLRSLPVRDPSRLVAIYRLNRGGQWAGITVSQIEEIRRGQSAFSGLYGRVYPNNSYVEAQGAIWPVNLGYVTGSYYSVLGVRPALGRLIAPDDVGLSAGTPTPVAVLSFDFWKRRYGGRRDLIGHNIVIAGKPFTVIGITPNGFFGEQVGFSLDITVPITEQPGRLAGPIDRLSCQYAIARLRDGIKIEQARAQLEAMWPGIRSETVPASATVQERDQFLSMSARLRVDPYPRNGFSYLRDRFASPLWTLAAIAGLVLLIACANLAGMLFAKSTARQKEMAIRIALGAGRWRLTHQLLIECLLLSLGGAAIGLVFANWASTWLMRFWEHIPFNPVTVLRVEPNLSVLGFTALAAIFTALTVGVAPAWYASRQSPAGVLQQAAFGPGRSSSRLGKVLVAAQVALSLVLVATGGLLVRSFEKISAFDPGFQYRHVAFLQLMAKPSQPGQPGKVDESYCRTLAQQLSSLPGVSSVAFSHMLPGLGFGGSERVGPSSTQSELGVDADFQIVSPEYFKTLGITLLSGRPFRGQDGRDSPRVAVISKDLAQQLFPAGNALGSYIRIGTDAERQRVRIVGIAADARIRDVQNPWPYIVYVPYFQEPEYISHWTNVEMLVQGNASDVLREAGQRVDSLDREYAMLSGPLEQVVDTGLAAQRATGYVAGFFTALALLLAAIGLYGLFSYVVIQRTRELGIRLALGAQHERVLWLVLREALLLVLAGFAAGLPAALAAGRLVKHILFGLSPVDPTTWMAVVGALLATALLGAYVPARRATKLDPMVALRYQ